MKLRSPAKINLFLNVLFKRKDGYHQIETLFERISLADELTLLPGKSGVKILSDSRAIPKGPKNLAYRAAQLLRKQYKIKQGVVIRIRKRIPLAAGLGGGSSNAAFTLIGLNKLWSLKLSKKKLCQLGASLGSDVPFFILGARFALARGRGEILKEIKTPRVRIWHCLVKPPFGISTKKAYQSLKMTRLAPPLRRGIKSRFARAGLTPKATNVKMLLHSIQKGHSSVLTNLLTNSLECAGHSTVPADVPRAKTRGLEHTLNNRVRIILEIKKELISQGAMGCLLSGSGPTVFGIFRSRNDARQAARFLRKKGRKIFVVSTF